MSLFYKTPRPLTMSSLPAVALLAIMDRVSLDDLLKNVGRVCKRWGRLKVLALARRRSLSLLVRVTVQRLHSPFNIPHLDELDSSGRKYPLTPEVEYRSLGRSTLHLNGYLTQDLARRIVDVMPKVACLRVVWFWVMDGRHSEMPQVVYLLTKWRSTLVTVKLFCSGSPLGQVLRQDAQLLSALNSLPRVQYLTLDVPGTRLSELPQVWTQATYTQVDLPVLARLKHLNWNTADHPNSLIDSLHKHYNGAVLRFAARLGDFLHKVPQAAKSRIVSITALQRLDPPIVVDHQLSRFCVEFANLESLSIRLKDLTTMARLTSQLEPLARTLIYLGMSFTWPLNDTRGGVVLSDELVVPLPSVRILVIRSETAHNLHIDLAPLRVSEAFPNIEVISVEDSITWYRFECEHRCQSMFYPGQMELCTLRHLQHLVPCVTLKAIYFDEKRFVRADLLQLVCVFNREPADEILLASLDRLSINELLSVKEEMCAQWPEVQANALQKRKTIACLIGTPECVQSLILHSPFTSTHNQAEIAFNSLTSRWLTPIDIARLVSTFSQIETLNIFQQCFDPACRDQIGLIERLLSQLKLKLINLTLIFENRYGENEFSVTGLLKCINEMPMLDRLSLEFPRHRSIEGYSFVPEGELDGLDGAAQEARQVEQLDLPVLGQLTRFQFRSRDHPCVLFESLKEYAGPNGRLQQIGISVESGLAWFGSQQFLTLPAELRAKVVYGAVPNQH